jgi:hypothetical protein
MNYLAATKEYYSRWLSVSTSFLDQKGTYCLYSPERDRIQEGYSKPFDFYSYFANRTSILTYGLKLENSMGKILEFYQSYCTLIDVINVIKDGLGVKPQHDIKYYLANIPDGIDVSRAKQLTIMDYPDYLGFFKTQYPNSQPETWLGEYFNEIAQKGYVFGLYVGKKLVSASDSPAMPFMKDMVVELGINTLPEYRKNGFGKIVLSAMLRFVTSLQKVPIVSCVSTNIASQELIQSVGFKKLADVVTLSL